MTEIKNFKDFGIVAETTSFVGRSIDVADIINREIVVYDYSIGPSKHPKKPGDQCLTMQIELDGEKRVVFSGSFYLQQMIQKVPRENGFPFKTIIKREKFSKRLEFGY